MPNTARESRYRFGYAKQSAEGSGTATPAFETSIYGGSLDAVETRQPYGVMDTTDLNVGNYKQMGMWTGDVEMNTDVNGMGLAWYLHFGGGDATSGAGPYTHVFTRSTSAIKWGSFHQLRPDIFGGTDIWEQGTDGFVKSIEITGSKGDPLHQKLELLGKTFQQVAAPTPTTDARLLQSATYGKYVTMIGAVLKLDVDASPATTAIHNIETFSIKSEYANAQLLQTDAFTPRYLDQGEYDVAFSATGVFEDFGLYRQTYFGTKSATIGTAQSQVIVNGAALFTFSVGPVADDANKLLTIALPAMQFTVTPPKPAPAGAAVRYAITGTLYKPAAGAEMTVTIINSTATY